MHRRTLILGTCALAAAARGANAAASPVVLELFTSQGCSSCPPADALLTELAARPEIVALTWHVDYWNRLGWRDPYATPEWTARQRRYAARLGAEVYTPALMVNGARMVVGSDRAAVSAAIAAAPALTVDATLHGTAGGLRAWVNTRPVDSVVTLAIYDATQATRVGAGENVGRTLTETHIVRAALSLPIPPEGGEVSLPPLVAGQGAVLLVQRPDLGMLGAAQLRAAGERVA